MPPPVSVVITVKNDAAGIAETLESLALQSQPADEVIVVDGGSSDSTRSIVDGFLPILAGLRCIDAPGVNIAQGRNIGIRAASHEIIAITDAGCRAEPNWLLCLTEPFDRSPPADFVAGFYRIAPQTLIEAVVGLATMRGQLEPVAPERFNPSARSMAFTKHLWQRAGGFPEWVNFSEDTLFDHKVRQMKVRWYTSRDAVVWWRPRKNLRAIARQFFNYGTGRGHTRIGQEDFHYNLRNMLIVLTLAAFSVVKPFFTVPLVFAVLYFYWFTFHAKAIRVARHIGTLRAYFLCLVVMGVVLISNTLGFLVGCWQRRRHPDRFAGNQAQYLSVPA